MPEIIQCDGVERISHCPHTRGNSRHTWREGDLLMWDNASTQHQAIFDYALPQRRSMHRTTVCGTPPF